ncbi:hypothetical protein BY996DRAFT_6415519 [Phakopsora pachyrhizi]|nr:hypothetical protein BY996DRAFT_6415519 [Phakopsora pachyrhizi]
MTGPRSPLQEDSILNKRVRLTVDETQSASNRVDHLVGPVDSENKEILLEQARREGELTQSQFLSLNDEKANKVSSKACQEVFYATQALEGSPINVIKDKDLVIPNYSGIPVVETDQKPNESDQMNELKRPTELICKESVDCLIPDGLISFLGEDTDGSDKIDERFEEGHKEGPSRKSSLYYARKSKKARSYRQKAMGLISTKEAKQMFWFLPKIDKPTCNQGQVRCKDITYVHFGRNVFYLKQGRVFMGIAEFLPFSEMSDSEFNDWNEVTKTLFNEKRIVREIRSASNSSSGSMFSTGWRKSSVKSELYGLTINKKKVQRNKELWEARKAKLEKVEAVLSSSFSNVADVLFTTARETFQQSGAPSFSSVSKSDKNTQNSFGSCLTATYGGFSNEPQISSDFHEIS